jgi:protein-tyrosine phosphatase
MDEQNIRGLKQLTSNPNHHDKIHLMTTFCRSTVAEYVPDPYSGDDQGFEHVIDLLEDACEGLYAVMSV